jgi:hypothetical protein
LKGRERRGGREGEGEKKEGVEGRVGRIEGRGKN